MTRGLGLAGVEVLRRLHQAGRRLAVAELAGRRDEHGNRVASQAAYRALLRAVHRLARRGLVESGRLERGCGPRLAVWLPQRGYRRPAPADSLAGFPLSRPAG
jgi:hypothetical protein